MTHPRIAVVGHCASGKSTVVALLDQLGYAAYSVAQEHSVVHDLWNHQQPDFVVVLDVSLDELRARKKNPGWPEWIFDVQSQRLAHARSHANLIVDTDTRSAGAVASKIIQFVEETQRHHQV